jgi:hypothetical protein
MGLRAIPFLGNDIGFGARPVGSVKDDDPVFLGRSFDKAARREILDHT